MNPEQMLNAVEECIRERPELASHHWVICWHEDRLKCLPGNTAIGIAKVFGYFTIEDLTKGLSIAQWSEVAKEIAEYFGEQKP